MRLIDLLTAGKQIKPIPKSEVPALLGELETIKARLWVRLTEWERPDSVPMPAKPTRDQTKVVEKSVKSDLRDRLPRAEGRILRMKEVLRLAGVSRSTIWNWIAEGKFPRQRHIGPRSIGWLDKEIYEWIKGRFGEV